MEAYLLTIVEISAEHRCVFSV